MAKLQLGLARPADTRSVQKPQCNCPECGHTAAKLKLIYRMWMRMPFDARRSGDTRDTILIILRGVGPFAIPDEEGTARPLTVSTHPGAAPAACRGIQHVGGSRFRSQITCSGCSKVLYSWGENSGGGLAHASDRSGAGHSCIDGDVGRRTSVRKDHSAQSRSVIGQAALTQTIRQVPFHIVRRAQTISVM